MSAAIRTAAALFALSIAGIGCRSGDRAATDAAIKPTTPRAEPPSAVGGGPGNDGPGNDHYVYSATSAMNVLSAAHCNRARTCGNDQQNCEGEAAAEHGDELARCDKGVDANALSSCAQSVRATACGASVAIPETCTATVLCKQLF